MKIWRNLILRNCDLQASQCYYSRLPLLWTQCMLLSWPQLPESSRQDKSKNKCNPAAEKPFPEKTLNSSLAAASGWQPCWGSSCPSCEAFAAAPHPFPWRLPRFPALLLFWRNFSSCDCGTCRWRQRLLGLKFSTTSEVREGLSHSERRRFVILGASRRLKVP